MTIISSTIQKVVNRVAAELKVHKGNIVDDIIVTVQAGRMCLVKLSITTSFHSLLSFQE